MRIVADEKYISRREQVGKICSFTGLGVLLAALVFSFLRPSSDLWIQLVLMGAMLVGIVLSFVGGYYGERFAGPLAHHEKVREALKGLDKRYVLFQYVLPVPHVLLGPDGLTTILVKSQPGQVTYEDGKWSHRQRGKFFRQMAGQEVVGAPEVDVERQVERVLRHLENELPGKEVPVRGLVLFVNPDVVLDLKDPPVPVFQGKKVKSWLRGPGMDKNIPAEARRKLEQLAGLQE